MAHHAGLYRRRQYWYFKYKDENGKWIEHATRTIDRKKALSIKSGFLRELETGQLPNDRSQWTLAKAAEAWLLDRKLGDALRHNPEAHRILRCAHWIKSEAAYRLLPWPEYESKTC